MSNSATTLSSRPTTPASTVDTYDEPSKAPANFLMNKKKKNAAPGTAPGALGDFVKWGKRKNTAVAPAPITMSATTPGGTAQSTAQNSDEEDDDDEDSDFETRMGRREDAVNQLFTDTAPEDVGDEADHMRTMMAKLVPSRVEDDYAMAKHMIFARQDRIDKIKEVLFNVSMVALGLLIYLICNSFIFREILSSLYGITHDSWSYTATVIFHGGALRVTNGGNLGVNVDVENGKYPLEMLPKTGNDNVIRLKSHASGAADPSNRMALVFGNQDLDGYDTAGSEIVGDIYGNLDHHGYGNVSINSAEGNILFGWTNDAKIGLGTNQPRHKVDVKGDTRILGDFILEGPDGGNSTMAVHGDAMGKSELRVNSHLDINGYLIGGQINKVRLESVWSGRKFIISDSFLFARRRLEILTSPIAT